MFIVALQALIPTPPVISGQALSTNTALINLVTPSQEPQTGINYYILQQLVHGSSLFFYQTIATLTAIQFPYAITGLAAGTTYQYQLLGVDNSAQADVSQPSAPILIVTPPPPPPPPSGSVKWAGAFHGALSVNNNGTPAGELSQMQLVRGDTNFYFHNTTWDTVDSTGTSSGYNFSNIFACMNQWLTQNPNGYYCENFQTAVFGTFTVNGSGPGGGIPGYILNNPGTYGAGPPGSTNGLGGYCIYDYGVLGPNLYAAQQAATWRPAVNAKFIAMFTAFMNTPFVTTAPGLYQGQTFTPNTHPRFYALANNDESSLAFGGPSGTPADFTIAIFLSASATRRAAMLAACPNTNWMSFDNYPPQPANGGGTPANVETLLAQTYQYRGVQSGPDVYPGGNSPSGSGGTPGLPFDAQQIYVGNIWSSTGGTGGANGTSRWLIGQGPSYGASSLTVAPNMGAFLQVEMPPDNKPGTTMQQICNTALLMKANGMFWNVLSGGGLGDWATQVRPVITNPANKLNPNAPKNYSPAPTFDYYISPNGSDGNPGTLASQWALTAINSKQSIYAGKRVGIIGDQGTYACLSILGGGSYTGDFSTPAFFIAGGTSSAQTYIASCNSLGVYTARLAVLDGQANASNNPNGQPLLGNVGSGCQYITIDGLEIKNGYNRLVSLGYQTAAFGGYTGPLSFGIIIQNCYVHTITNAIAAANSTAITIYSSNGAIAQNNKITDMSDSEGRADAIEFWTSQNSIAQYNTVIATGPGMYAGICNKNASNYNNTIRFNYIDLTLAGTGVNQGGIVMDSDGSGSTTDTANNNIVISDLPVGPYLIATGAFPASVNKQLWYNNTFIGIPGNSTVNFYRNGAAGTMTYYNNIIKTSSVGYRGDLNINTSAAALMDCNMYPSSPQLGLSADGTQNPPTIYTSLAAWAAALPSGCVGKDAHSLTTVPSFTNSGTLAQLYELVAGSAGSATSANPGRVGGVTSGAAVDMGAWGGASPPTQIGSNF